MVSVSLVGKAGSLAVSVEGKEAGAQREHLGGGGGKGSFGQGAQGSTRWPLALS